MKLTLKSWRPIEVALTLALLTLLVLSYLHARLNLEEASSAQRLGSLEELYRLPSSEVLSAVTLNYTGLAADLVWLRGLTYFGQMWDMHHTPEYLEDYASTVADLDPRFYHVYEWFAATYLNTAYPIDETEIERVNRFIDRGIAKFPGDPRLPYVAGMHYIGYSRGASVERRLREATRAIRYLSRAAQLEGAPATTTATLAWFHARKQRFERKLQGKDALSDSDSRLGTEEAELFAELYLTVSDEQQRRRLEQLLKSSGDFHPSVLEKVKQYRHKLESAQIDSLSYLEPDLWTTILTAEETR